MQKIAVCGNPRSGTSSLYRFFEDLGVDSVHEPFLPGKWKGPRDVFHDGKWKGPRDEKAYDIVEEVAKLYDDHHAMKHLWPHVPDQVNRRLIQWLVSHGVKVIHIERTNRLAQAISMTLAFETGIWSGTKDPGRREAYLEQCASIRLDVEALKQRMTKLEAQDCNYKQLLAQGNLLSVKHEQLYGAAPPQVEDTVRKMLQFTELDPEAGQLRLAMDRFHPSHKQTITSVYALIPNIAEIEAAFGVKLT